MSLINEVEENGIPEEHTRFKIEDKSQASWALKKIAKIIAEKRENEEVANIEIERTKNWLKKENEELERHESFFEFLLHEYHRKELEIDPKSKTIKLPFGTLKMRTQQPEYLYDDEKLIVWAKNYLPEAVQVKESVLKTPIKKHIKETGEVIDGVTITERPDKFIVEV